MNALSLLSFAPPALALSLVCFSASVAADESLAYSDSSFVTPASPYCVSPDDKVVQLRFEGGDAAALQQLIDKARKRDAKAILVVRVSGDVRVKDEPLLLGSCINLILSSGSKWEYVGKEKATAMVDMRRATTSSICTAEGGERAIIDGKGMVEQVISVQNGALLCFDRLTVQGGTKAGISYKGNGDAQLDQTSSVTRCLLRDNKGCALIARDAGRFIALDNVFESNPDTALLVTSQSAMLCGNQITGSKMGINYNASRIGLEGPGALLARNKVKDCQNGISLGRYADRTLFTENSLVNNQVGLLIAGEYSHIYHNSMDNKQDVVDKGRATVIAHHKGLTPEGLSANATTKFFNPPTASNPHRNECIVLGMERVDVEITQKEGEPDIDLVQVQALMKETRAAKPNHYLVVWMKGQFVASGEYTGLSLPSNCSVILDGTIYPKGEGMDRRSKENHYAKAGNSGGTQLVLMKEPGYVSFSGGLIDGMNSPAYGIYAPGKNVCVINGVSLKGAVDNNIGVLHHMNADTPAFIHECQFDGQKYTNRGVWAHICDFVHCIANQSRDHVADYVDIDAEGHNCSVLFSTTYNEKRCGVFVEENASNNIIFGNTFTGTVGSGISLYSALGQIVKNNLLVRNNFKGTHGMNIRHARFTTSFNNSMDPSTYILENAQGNKCRYGVYLNVKDNVSLQNQIKGTMSMGEAEENSYYAVPQ